MWFIKESRCENQDSAMRQNQDSAMHENQDSAIRGNPTY